MFFSTKKVVPKYPPNFRSKTSTEKPFFNSLYTENLFETALNNIDLPDKVDIFDTTLRDGEGTPGVNFTFEEKVEIAKALDDIGVTAIEAGSPVTSKAELKTFKEIIKNKAQSEICGLSRVVRGDIEACVDVDVDRICEDVFSVLDAIYVEDLWDRSGATSFGYVTPEDMAIEMMEEELESLRSKAEKGGKRIISRVEILIEQYLHVPHLKNYLSAAYEASGKKNRTS